MEEVICKKEIRRGIHMHAEFIPAQELVRCKDCKFKNDSLRCDLASEGIRKPDDWFCADGIKRTPMTKIEDKFYIIKGEFHTDGDYYLDFGQWDFTQNGYDRHFWHDDEIYSFTLITDDIYYARDFLATLITIYRVGSSHYSLIKSLYNMTESIIIALFDDSVKEANDFISGNYDGTHIYLKKGGTV